MLNRWVSVEGQEHVNQMSLNAPVRVRRNRASSRGIPCWFVASVLCLAFARTQQAWPLEQHGSTIPRPPRSTIRGWSSEPRPNIYRSPRARRNAYIENTREPCLSSADPTLRWFGGASRTGFGGLVGVRSTRLGACYDRCI